MEPPSELVPLTGAGNRFLLLDRRRAEAGATARLVIYNRDGSRPEACGNGLRCAGWYLMRAGALGREVCLETDAGRRGVTLVREDGRLAVLRAELGAPTRSALATPPPGPFDDASATGVRLGNPHCVLRVPDERRAPVAAVGARMQEHPDYPSGVNVGFLARRSGAWHLRVWERGVGETEACGTGACAAAVTIGGPWPIVVHMPGGALRVTEDAEGALWLEGHAELCAADGTLPETRAGEAASG